MKSVPGKKKQQTWSVSLPKKLLNKLTLDEKKGIE